MRGVVMAMVVITCVVGIITQTNDKAVIKTIQRADKALQHAHVMIKELEEKKAMWDIQKGQQNKTNQKKDKTIEKTIERNYVIENVIHATPKVKDSVLSLKKEHNNSSIKFNPNVYFDVFPQVFPFISQIMDVTKFREGKDKCNSTAPKTGFYINVDIPENKMIRVSTCNKDTTVHTQITMTYQGECVKTVERKCRRWPGSIVEYIPRGKYGMRARIRIGANKVKKGKVSVSVFTVPVTQKNKKKLIEGKIISSLGKNGSLLQTKVRKSYHPSAANINELSTSERNELLEKASLKHNKILQQNVDKFSWIFKVTVATFTCLVLCVVAMIVVMALKRASMAEVFEQQSFTQKEIPILVEN